MYSSWEAFENLDIRVGTIVAAEDFPEAKKPAYKLKINFGPEIGIKQSSAQITQLYTKDQLLNQQVICVCNFPPKQVGPFISQVLVTGFYSSQGIILAQPKEIIANGSKLG